jgi:hypothetical protein
VQALRLHHEVAGMMKSEQELREKLKGLLAMDADKISPTFIYSKRERTCPSAKKAAPRTGHCDPWPWCNAKGYLGAGWAR